MVQHAELESEMPHTSATALDRQCLYLAVSCKDRGLLLRRSSNEVSE